jgi:hypothetical protein
MAERNSHSYKCKDIFYNKAKKRATKEKGSLTKLIECVVVAYSHGMRIVAQSGDEKQKYITLDEVAAIAELQPKK